MTLSIELFPAPFGPMIAQISPRATSKLMSLMAFTPAKDRSMCSRRKIGNVDEIGNVGEVDEIDRRWLGEGMETRGGTL
jgi:hypothetical protein